MKHRSCPWRKVCRNGGDGCYSIEPKNCVRFLPLDGTNLTNITGVVETPPEIDSMGWSFCGSFSPYEDEELKG